MSPEFAIAMSMYAMGLLACGSIVFGAAFGLRQGLVTPTWRARVTATAIGLMVVVVVATGLGAFEYRFGSLISPLFIGYMTLVPLAAYWAATSKHVGKIARAMPLHWLVGVQTLRMAGGLLLAEYAVGNLPAYFAFTVGGGDLLTGLLAPFVALWAYKKWSGWRAAVWVWQIFAIADLCHSAVAATLSADTPFQLLPDLGAVLGQLPVAPLVVFLVPIAFVWCIVTFRHLKAGD
jgi:hypothetical protein